jgi:hypothetical protein
VGAANNSGLFPPETEGGVLLMRSRASKGGRYSRAGSRCGCCGLGRVQVDLYNNDIPKRSVCGYAACEGTEAHKMLTSGKVEPALAPNNTMDLQRREAQVRSSPLQAF